MNGTIKALRLDRGYGFITAEDGVEHFFHADDAGGQDALRSLAIGDEVQFEPVVPVPLKGPRADAVEKIGARMPA